MEKLKPSMETSEDQIFDQANAIKGGGSPSYDECKIATLDTSGVMTGNVKPDTDHVTSTDEGMVIHQVRTYP
jgi:hypothetical protein